MLKIKDEELVVINVINLHTLVYSKYQRNKSLVVLPATFNLLEKQTPTKMEVITSCVIGRRKVRCKFIVDTTKIETYYSEKYKALHYTLMKDFITVENLTNNVKAKAYTIAVEFAGYGSNKDVELIQTFKI